MRSLVIGYGNPSRRDDAVGQRVVNALRARWGQPPLGLADDGWDELGGERDTLFVQQLVPELAEVLSAYDLAVFVDVALSGAGVQVQAVEPGAHLSSVSHHMGPSMLLALAERLYGRRPRTYLVSVRGHDFGFGEQLSPEVEAALPAVVERVAELAEERRSGEG